METRDPELLHDATTRSIVLYSNDGIGLGHLGPVTRIASGIRERRPEADILIVCSSPAVGAVSLLDGFEYIKLPSVTEAWKKIFLRHPIPPDPQVDRLIALRSALLLTTVQQMRPDVLFIEHQPLGMRQEVLPTLQWIRGCAPECQTVLALFDVLDRSPDLRKRWEHHGVYEALDRLYDSVLVLGDPQVFDVREAYAMPASAAKKVRYVGYLGRSPERKRDEIRRELGLGDERLIVVSVGGGESGTHLIETYLQSVQCLPEDVRSLIVTGPSMSPDERERVSADASQSRVTIVASLNDLASYIAASDLSVSMAGYSTMCEVVSAGVRGIVVPRVTRPHEQLIRAQLFEERGLVTVMMPDSLTAESLADTVQRLLAAPPPRAHGLDFTGLPRTSAFLAELLDGWKPEQEASSTAIPPLQK